MYGNCNPPEALVCCDVDGPWRMVSKSPVSDLVGGSVVLSDSKKNSDMLTGPIRVPEIVVFSACCWYPGGSSLCSISFGLEFSLFGVVVGSSLVIMLLASLKQLADANFAILIILLTNYLLSVR